MPTLRVFRRLTSVDTPAVPRTIDGFAAGDPLPMAFVLPAGTDVATFSVRNADGAEVFDPVIVTRAGGDIADVVGDPVFGTATVASVTLDTAQTAALIGRTRRWFVQADDDVEWFGIIRPLPDVGHSSFTPPPVATTLTLSPAGPITINETDTQAATATVLDQYGAPMADGTVVTLSSSVPADATVPATAAVAGGAGVASFTVTGVSSGATVITATAGAASDTLSVTLTGLRRVVVADRSSYTTAFTNFSDGSETQRTFASKHRVYYAASALELTWLNFGATGTGAAGETDPANAVTFRAAVEYPIGGGTRTPVFFGAGVREGACAAGAFITGTCALSIPAGADVLVYTRPKVASAGQKWVQNYVMHVARGEGSVTGDLVDAGAVTGQGPDIWGMAPWALTGLVSGAARAVGIVSDSWGDGDYLDRPGYPGADLYSWNAGPLHRRAHADGIPAIEIAIPGEYAQSWASATTAARRRALLAAFAPYLTDLVWLLCNNDGALGRTALQMEADLSACYAWGVGLTGLGGLALRQTAVTVPPYTTSTDNWATVVNQTPVAAWAPGGAVHTLNAWHRGGGAHPDANVSFRLDMAYACMDADGSNTYYADGVAAKWTQDGRHGTANLYIRAVADSRTAMAAVMTPR